VGRHPAGGLRKNRHDPESATICRRWLRRQCGRDSLIDSDVEVDGDKLSPCDFECRKNVKNIKSVAVRCALSSSKRMKKTRFRPGSGARDLTTLPLTQSRSGRGTPPLHTLLPSTPSASRFLGPSKQNFWLRLMGVFPSCSVRCYTRKQRVLTYMSLLQMGGTKQCLFSSIHRDTLYITGTGTVSIVQTDRPTVGCCCWWWYDDNDDDVHIQLVDNRTGLWDVACRRHGVTRCFRLKVHNLPIGAYAALRATWFWLCYFSVDCILASRSNFNQSLLRHTIIMQTTFWS